MGDQFVHGLVKQMRGHDCLYVCRGLCLFVNYELQDLLQLAYVALDLLVAEFTRSPLMYWSYDGMSMSP